MKSPLQLIPNQGLTLSAKFAWTAGMVIYILSPVDFLPAAVLTPLIGSIDDFMALAMLIKVWRVPRLELIDVLKGQWEERQKVTHVVNRREERRHD